MTAAATSAERSGPGHNPHGGAGDWAGFLMVTTRLVSTTISTLLFTARSAGARLVVVEGDLADLDVSLNLHLLLSS